MSLTFLAVGLCAFSAALAAQRFAPRKAEPWSVLGAILGVGILGFSLLPDSRTLGPEKWWQQGFVVRSILFVALISGMMVRCLTRAIEERRERVSKWRQTGSRGRRPGVEIDGWEFAYPLLLSAITFAALLPQLKSDGITTENFLLSFQTGFFWQTLMAVKATPSGAAARPAGGR